MANLIIDIGNTAVKASWADGMTLGKTYRYQGENLPSFISLITEKKKPELLVISSVYPISESDENLFKKECNKLIILDKNHTDLLKKKGLPLYLSYDRAASILAAGYLFKGKSCTIVDFGTTLTVDFIDENCNYQGGNISLGYRTRFRAVNRYSRSLPLINTPNDAPEIGNDFESSITAGILSGIMFEIEGYSRVKSGNIMIFTGGDSIFFEKRMKNSIFVVCNLVLIGLALIADEYVRKII